MNTSYYRNFITVVECGNISNAATKLLIAQPALSNQLKNIENMIGTKLFIRHPRKLELTEAGKVFYDTARNVLQIEENMQTEIHNVLSGDSGLLKVGITPAMPDPFFQKLLEAYHCAYPKVVYDIYENNSDTLIYHLKNNIIDIAVIRTISPYVSPDLEVVANFAEHYYAFRRYDSPFLSDADHIISLERLEGVPISIGRGLARYFNDCCNQRGFSPTIRSVNSSRSTILYWAQFSETVAVLSMPQESRADSLGLQYHRIEDTRLVSERSFVVCKSKSLPSTAANFLKMVELAHQAMFTSENS
jgi:DNA-binding transcriptional LysR family regulator